MSKHTPGPWHHDEYGEIWKEGQKIGRAAHFYVGNFGRISGYMPYEANARLIAAAPELLDMVERLSASLTRTNGADQRLYLDAKKLIAKIEGDE